jgi:adenosylhomocysteinase
MIAGKVAVVAGYGDVGKGCADSHEGAGARVMVTEIDPICALQAAMEGYEVVTMEDAAPRRHLRHRHRQCWTSSPGAHSNVMKDKAIVCNIGHFDIEIDVAWLEKHQQGSTSSRRSTSSSSLTASDLILLAKWPLVNLGCANRPSQLRDVHLVHQPGAGPDRALVIRAIVSEKWAYTCCPSISTRRSLACTSRSWASSCRN